MTVSRSIKKTLSLNSSWVTFRIRFETQSKATIVYFFMFFIKEIIYSNWSHTVRGRIWVELGLSVSFSLFVWLGFSCFGKNYWYFWSRAHIPPPARGSARACSRFDSASPLICFSIAWRRGEGRGSDRKGFRGREYLNRNSYCYFQVTLQLTKVPEVLGSLRI